MNRDYESESEFNIPDISMSVELHANLSIPGTTSIDITVYEDLNGDGTVDNSDSAEGENGNNVYVLGNLAGTGEDYWLEIETQNPNITQAASINSLTLVFLDVEALHTLFVDVDDTVGNKVANARVTVKRFVTEEP